MIRDRLFSVGVAGDAEDRIHSLGVQQVLSIIVDYLKTTVPDARGVEVTPFFSDPFQPHLMLRVYRDLSIPDVRIERELRRWNFWLYRAFPPEVADWFLFDVCERAQWFG